MDLQDLANVATVIGCIVGILALTFVTKFVFKSIVNKNKKVGRDDNSITFGDGASVKKSFNKESSFIKKDK